MSVYIGFSPQQNEILSAIKREGHYEGEKTCILVLLATNDFARMDYDLAKILSNYPGLSSPEILINHIHELEEAGSITKCRQDVGTGEEWYYYMDSACLDAFLATLSEETGDKIRACRGANKQTVCVSLMGLLSGGENRGYNNASFIERLSQAQTEIMMPMLNTAPNPVVIDVLRERASAGVKVKILLPDFEKVVKKIRDDQEYIAKGWIEQLQGTRNIEIRIYSTIEDASIYSSVIVDRKLCRIVVFDPKREVSSKGTLIEVTKTGFDLNLIEMMIERFEKIWNRSRPVGRRARACGDRKWGDRGGAFLRSAPAGRSASQAEHSFAGVASQLTTLLCGMMIAFVYQDVIKPMIKKNRKSE